MIKIDRDTLYFRADLAEALTPAGVDVDHFIARLRPRKVFKMVWLGEDILAALRAAPALADREEAHELSMLVDHGNRKRRRGPVRADRPGAKLDAYLKTLKEGRS